MAWPAPKNLALGWRGGRGLGTNAGGFGHLKSNSLLFKPYNALYATQAPTPLPTLQNAAGGWFPCVLAVLLGLDVYAEGM